MIRALFAALLLVLSPAFAAARGSYGYRAEDVRRITLQVSTPSDERRLALAGIDLEETEIRRLPGGRMIVRALAGPNEMHSLMDQHVAFEVDSSYRAHDRFAGSNDNFWAGYRTYAQMTTQISAWASTYPALISPTPLGPTWQTQQGSATRYIWGLRLASSSGLAGPKVLLDFCHHCREINTPEVAMMFVDELLQNAATDPLYAWLLANRETWILPMMNPDGHVEVETGNCWKRKNMNTNFCPSGGEPGVDLNRNYPFQWGQVGGATSNIPCDATFFGPSAGSEPEVQALIALYNQKNFPVWISHHNYVHEFLWPWAYTTSPPPSADAVKFAAMGARAVQLANAPGAPICGNYAHGQASTTLYVASGTSKDWGYGVMNALAYTYELDGGDTCDFWPTYASITGATGTYARIKPMLVWTMNIADNAGSRAQAPMAVQSTINVFPNPSLSATAVTVTCQFDNVPNAAPVTAAEFWVDTLGADGTGTPMTGSFGSTLVTATGLIPVGPLSQGQHTVYVRGREATRWGSVAVQWFSVSTVAWTPTITATFTPTATPGPTNASCSPRVYPNPFRRGSYAVVDCVYVGAASPDSVTVPVFTVSGELVVRLPVSSDSTGRHSAIWDGLTASGDPAASGIYLAVVPTAAGHEVLKLVLQ